MKFFRTKDELLSILRRFSVSDDASLKNDGDYNKRNRQEKPSRPPNRPTSNLNSCLQRVIEIVVIGCGTKDTKLGADVSTPAAVVRAIAEEFFATERKENDIGTAIEASLPDVLWLCGVQVSSMESDEEKQLSAQWRKLCEFVREAVDAGIVKKQSLLERLETDLIAGASLCRNDSKSINTQLVRSNTNRLYKQRKFNLLNEASEGYAKLVTVLEQLNESNTDQIISHVRGLIGLFSLDPNRVCDIVLDVYEGSPENISFDNLLSCFPTKNLSQQLGFKLQMYHPLNSSESSSESMGSFRETPFSLLYFCAILIKRKRLSVSQVMPHLFPCTSRLKFSALSEQDNLIQEAKVFGRVKLGNATQADRDKEEEVSRAKREAFEKRCVSEAMANQKFGLVAGLFAVGEWDMAMKVAKGMDETFSAVDHPQVKAVLFAQIRATIAPLAHKTLMSHVIARSRALEFRNYENTAQRVASAADLIFRRRGYEPASTAEEFLSRCQEILVVLGHRLGEDISMFFTVVRILKNLVLNDGNDAEENGSGRKGNPRSRKDMYRVLDLCIIPSLSVIESPNPPLSLEIWDIVKQYPYAARFDLYERYKSLHSALVPRLVYSASVARHGTKRIIKRLASTKEAVKAFGKAIAKRSVNNPIESMDEILLAAESYDNLIIPLVDAIKALSPLTFDVLAFLIVQHLGKNEAGKIKQDGTNVSHWFQSLCKFIGHFYSKYPAVEMRGLFRFLLRQLKQGRCMDLLALEELTSKMAGIEVVNEFSDDALAAMGGGDLLRSQARLSVGAGSSLAKKRPLARLRSALEEGDRQGDRKGGILLPLLLLISQKTQTVLFEKDGSNLKLIGHKYDMCCGVLSQFVEFVAQQIPIEELAVRHLLPIFDLVTGFGLEPVVAFHVARPVIAAASLLHRLGNVVTLETLLDSPKVKMSEKVAELWRLDAVNMRDMAKKIVADKGSYGGVLSPDIYLFFWCNSLYDVQVPRLQYDKEVARLQQVSSGLLNARSNEGEVGGDRSSEKMKNLEVGRLARTQEKLKEELTLQTENRAICLKDFETRKKMWFSMAEEPKTNPSSLAADDMEIEKSEYDAADLCVMPELKEFFQLCLLPRLLFSATDAVFCARFLRLLHERSVPNVSTMAVMNLVVKYVAANIFCVTEREAGHLGVFLRDMLLLLREWSKSKNDFSQNFGSKLGSLKNPANSKLGRYSLNEFLEHLDNWHSWLGTIFSRAFESKSFMKIRSALLVTSKIIEVFPSKMSTAKELREKAKALADHDERPDIKTMARRYEVLLSNAIKLKKLKADVSTAVEKQKQVSSAVSVGKTSQNQRRGTSEKSTGAIPESEPKTSDKPQNNVKVAAFETADSKKSEKANESTSEAKSTAQTESIKSDASKGSRKRLRDTAPTAAPANDSSSTQNTKKTKTSQKADNSEPPETADQKKEVASTETIRGLEKGRKGETGKVRTLSARVNQANEKKLPETSGPKESRSGSRAGGGQTEAAPLHRENTRESARLRDHEAWNRPSRDGGGNFVRGNRRDYVSYPNDSRGNRREYGYSDRGSGADRKGHDNRAAHGAKSGVQGGSRDTGRGRRRQVGRR